ncbi:MAG TPA: response regulator [Lacunisphaera sp.]|nr:response regulator [Lacunisphaera sp.]
MPKSESVFCPDSMPHRILLAEDQNDNRAIVRGVLEEHGFEVAEASDGIAALQALLEAPFDAVITDILMPRMDGYRLCHEIRHHPRLRSLPIIVYTATYTSASDEQLSLDLGADRFLRKPATGPELIRTLRELLGDRHRIAPAVTCELGELGAMHEYSQGLVDKLEDRSLQLEKQAQALRASELRSRQVFNAANDAMFLVSLDGQGRPDRVVDANEAASDLLGYSHEELLGRPVHELEVAEGEEPTIAALSDRLSREKRLVFERTLKSKDGRRIPTELSVRSFPAEVGPMVIAAARDITERKRAEEAQRRNAQQLRDILDGLFSFVGLLSLDGILLEVNRAALEVGGLKREDVVGTYFPQAYWWSHSPDVQLQLKDALARAIRGEFIRYDVAIRVAGGREMIVDFAVSPLREEGGRVSQLVATAVDITERKKLEQQFLRAQRMEAIGTLASGVAHDLNNILAPMLMGAGLLKNKLTSEREQAILNIIETGAQRGAGIIRQLLTFSRGTEVARSSVQLRHLINDMHHLAQETFPRNLELERKVPADLWAVKADPTQLHQVLMNLCVNARDAMPDGGRLTLSAENVRLSEAQAKLNPQAKPGPYVVLTVADTGEGIPREIIERIFDPFFTTKPVGKGTGLGLSTVLAIAKNHGGFVTVYSEPGKGSVFKVYLPAAETPGTTVAADATDVPRGNGELLLLVDDEPGLRESTRLVLEENGYRVLTATNGEEGVREFLARRDEVRAVVTDMMMPVMDGVDMIRTIRLVAERLPIVGMSGMDEIKRRDELAALGVREVLMKPCEPRLLLQAIHAELNADPRMKSDAHA